MTATISRRSSFASNASSLELSDYGTIIVLRRNDGKDGASFPIEDRYVTFGKHEENDIRINRPNVDDFHCVLLVDLEARIVLLKNLSTKHSLLLNENEVQPMTNAEVLNSTVISISDRKFRFQQSEEWNDVNDVERKRRRSEMRESVAGGKGRRKSIAIVTNIRNNGELELQLTPRKARRSLSRRSSVGLSVLAAVNPATVNANGVAEDGTTKKRLSGMGIEGEEENAAPNCQIPVPTPATKSTGEKAVNSEELDKNGASVHVSPELKSRRRSSASSVASRGSPAFRRISYGNVDLPTNPTSAETISMNSPHPVNEIQTPRLRQSDRKNERKRPGSESTKEEEASRTPQDSEGRNEMRAVKSPTIAEELPVDAVRTPRTWLAKELPMNAVTTPRLRLAKELPVNAVSTPAAKLSKQRSETITVKMEDEEKMDASEQGPELEHEHSAAIVESTAQEAQIETEQPPETPRSDHLTEILPVEAVVTPRIRLSKEVAANAVVTPVSGRPTAEEPANAAQTPRLRFSTELPINAVSTPQVGRSSEEAPISAVNTPHQEPPVSTVATPKSARMSEELPINAVPTPKSAKGIPKLAQISEELPFDAVVTPKAPGIPKELPVDAVMTPKAPRFSTELPVDAVVTPKVPRISKELPVGAVVTPKAPRISKELPVGAVVTPKAPRISKELPVNAVATPRQPSASKEQLDNAVSTASTPVKMDEEPAHVADGSPAASVATTPRRSSRLMRQSSTPQRESVGRLQTPNGSAMKRTRSSLGESDYGSSSNEVVGVFSGETTPIAENVFASDVEETPEASKATPRRSSRLQQTVQSASKSVEKAARTLSSRRKSTGSVRRSSSGTTDPKKVLTDEIRKYRRNSDAIASSEEHESTAKALAFNQAPSEATPDEVENVESTALAEVAPEEDSASLRPPYSLSEEEPADPQPMEEQAAAEEKVEEMSAAETPDVEEAATEETPAEEPVEGDSPVSNDFVEDSEGENADDAAEAEPMNTEMDFTEDTMVPRSSEGEMKTPSPEPADKLTSSARRKSCLKTPLSCRPSSRLKSVFFADAIGKTIELEGGAHYSPKRQLRRRNSHAFGCGRNETALEAPPLMSSNVLYSNRGFDGNDANDSGNDSSESESPVVVQSLDLSPSASPSSADGSEAVETSEISTSEAIASCENEATPDESGDAVEAVAQDESVVDSPTSSDAVVEDEADAINADQEATEETATANTAKDEISVELGESEVADNLSSFDDDSYLDEDEETAKARHKAGLWMMTVVRLRKILAVKDVNTKGRKSELVDRILEHFDRRELHILEKFGRDDLAWLDQDALKPKLASYGINVCAE